MVALLQVGIDIGGTFTDFVVFNPEKQSITTFKLPSTPQDPSEAVLDGLDKIRHDAQSDAQETHFQIIHGSTVATNTLLERKGARTVLISTAGFSDVIEIGRQNRPFLYQLYTPPQESLIPSNCRLEAAERIDSHGQILTPLTDNEIDRITGEVNRLEPTSVAVCLLFSFLNTTHEARIGARLRQAGYLVSLSSEILPEYREYERASTTSVNAYVSPILDKYLSRLETSLPSGSTRLRVMQSNGGQIGLAEARRSGVRCILSGPAGGVVGALAAGRLALESSEGTAAASMKLLTFDMGGTSTDVSLIDGAPQTTTESVVGGFPIRIPVLDIHTIGAGGGSIAHVDPGGALRVGPQSAGADPGPACYARSDASSAPATVTDANLVLGRLDPSRFLGGKMPLDSQRAHLALERLGGQLSLDTFQTALGIIEVVNAHMERALRVISVERGRDPREFSLISFGGAGGLHAVDLARRLDIPQVIIPPLASTLSALGMLQADVVKDYTLTVMISGETPASKIDRLFEPMINRGIQEILLEGIPEDCILIEPSLDMRYRGQSYELSVPWHREHALIADFDAAHRTAYGFDRPGAPVEIVNLRVRAIGKINPPQIAPRPLQGTSPQQAFIENRPVYLNDTTPVTIPLYQHELLQPGNLIPGPGLMIRNDTSILIGKSDRAVVDSYLNLIISVHPVSGHQQEE